MAVETDQRLRDLTNVGKQALDDYDELLHKYNELVEEHEKTVSELNELQSVAEPMYDEYGKIHTKYEFEKSLRAAAESYASKVVKDHNKMKRQSAMLIAQLNTVKPIAIDIDIEETEDEQAERIEELNGTISELHDKVADYESELKKKDDEINIMSAQTDTLIAEKEEYRLQCESLEKQINTQGSKFLQQQRELKSLKRVSSLAYTDYTSLQERYDTEKALRLKAEVYARELQRKRDSVVEDKRASAQNGLDDSGNESLQKLVAENDRLHADLSEQETKYIAQIEDLEQQLKDSSSNATMENLEDKLEAVKEDLERVTEELQKQKHDNSHLKQTITKLESERDEFMRIPIPPPPPPPPGPAAGISNILVSKRKKKEKTLEKVVGKNAVNNDTMQSAIQEMMSRIRTGTGLKAVDMNARPDDMSPKQEEGGAMKEMHQYLVSMKKSRRVQAAAEATESSLVDDELAKKLKKRRERSNSDADPTQESEGEGGKFIKQPSLDSNARVAPVPMPRQRSGSTNKPQPPPVQPKPANRSGAEENNSDNQTK